MSDDTPTRGSRDRGDGREAHTDAPDGEYRAVVDRIEDGLATLLLERDEATVGQVLVAPDRLPPEARHADAILTVAVEDESLVECRYEERETDQRQEEMQSRFDRLARRREEGDGDDRTAETGRSDATDRTDDTDRDD